MICNKVHWGILGTGNIARVFAKGIANSNTGKLFAVASRNLANAQAFGKEFDVPFQYGSYEALIADPKVQVVYIALPHVFHAEWAIRAANAGKHILCEKPLATNYTEAQTMVGAARCNDIFLMEALMYRCHPQTAKLIELLRAKVIGEVRIIQATFSFQADFDLTNRALSNDLGGGGILDVGCYPISMARLIAGIVLGKEYAEPLEVYGVGHIGELSHIDEWSICCLKFPRGILAQVAAGVFLKQENVVRIFGSDGNIFIPSPWVPGGREPGITRIFIRKRGENRPQEIITETKMGLYAMEADMVATSISLRQSPVMKWEDSLGNMKTMDRWRQIAGVSYPSDGLTSRS
jgi:predicted dehydrogenase